MTATNPISAPSSTYLSTERKPPCSSQQASIVDEVKTKHLQAASSSSHSAPKFKLPFFIDLMNEMSKAGFAPKGLGEFSLAHLFLGMEKAFSGLLQDTEKSLQGGDTLVLGNTGVGKSLFIGYLLGEQIKEKKIPRPGRRRFRSVLDYGQAQGSSTARPSVGHSASKTKGCQAYGPYLDSAGFNDTSGLEIRTCNAKALRLSLELYKPRKLIVVSDPNSCFIDRAQGFFRLIKDLRKNIEGITDQAVWPHILFVFNRPREHLSREAVEDKIADAIDIITDELNSSSKNLQIKLVEWSKSQSPPPSLSREEQILAEHITALQEERQILERLLHKGNFIVANLISHRTRDEVDSWRQKPGGIPFESYNLQAGAPNSHSKFLIALHAALNYFQFLEAQVKAYDAQISEHQRSITELESALSSGTADVEKLAKELGDKALQRANTSIAIWSKEAQELDLAATSLAADKSPVEWPELLRCEEEIKTRRLWDFKGKKYRFEFKEEASPIKLEYLSATGGSFYKKLDKNYVKVKQGEAPRLVCYLPPIRRKSSANENRTAIRVWVENKDHPETQVLIEQKLKEQALLKEKIQLATRVAVGNAQGNRVKILLTII